MKSNNTIEKYAKFIGQLSSSGTVFNGSSQIMNTAKEAKLSASFIYDLKKIGVTQDHPEGGFMIKPNIHLYHSAKKIQRLQQDRQSRYQSKQLKQAVKMKLAKPTQPMIPSTDQALVNELRKRGYEVTCTKLITQTVTL